ncbi:MAG: cytochrome c biogenesis protein [Saprospiraceae bacterium]|nr:MAG: cytochrome c biogenesis protein [Saprospiraceae bacterium]
MVKQIAGKIFATLFSMRAAGMYMIAFAAAIGIATFIENDFGTSSAQKLVFQARWFEVLLALFAICLIVNIVRYRMVQQKKWTILTFHAAMIVILLGAGITRYFGYEGMMHIREGDTSNTFLSRETYLIFEAKKGDQLFRFHEPVLFATLGDNTFEKAYRLGGQDVHVAVTGFMPNPKETMVDDENGVPVLRIVMGGASGREEYHLKLGDRSNIRGVPFNFGNAPVQGAVNIALRNDSLFFMAYEPFEVTVMATQEKSQLEPAVWHPLRLRSLYANDRASFVFGMYSPHARVEIISADPKMTSTSMGGVQMRIRTGGEESEFMVVGAQGIEGRPRRVQVGGMDFAVSYGSRRVQLPFALKLNDFILEKYPGTESASSYESRVTLLDPRNGTERDVRIYMNNILNYDGYRFFQSSFDQDELGTYLSVNYDAPGTLVSYLGYALLTLGMLLMFFDKKSRFQQLSKQVQRIRQARRAAQGAVAGILLLFALPLLADSPPFEASVKRIPQAHADNFGRLIVQDYRGRFKPMNTHSSEIVRKLTRKEKWDGLDPDQIVISMTTWPEDWYHVPMIKLGNHEDVKKLLGVTGKYCSYADFFDSNGKYKLHDAVRKAYNTPQRDRGTYEKEILKLDEKVNICSMVFSGEFMRVFPLVGDPNHTWVTPGQLKRQPSKGSEMLARFYDAYTGTVAEAMQTGDWSLANQLIDELRNYQRRVSAEVLPSESKLSAELLLNRLDVFSRLMGVYYLLGLLFTGLLFTSVFKPSLDLKWPIRIGLGLFFLAFLYHLFGLGMRWYVSGRAPWSNGYESMIYIAFTTVLAGLLFARKSLGGLAATNILGGTALMVAGLSFLDPEITPLVPVLKSYWLTIHVSLEAGSYGFLMLGALIGVINLVFMILANQRNHQRVYNMIREMTYISEMTLIAGLVMISIGTYLGGVWANESWGRYWGWDPKETWALVTILVYAFILHMRFIPGFRGLYAFNVATLFGWASVIMTYFGVNYYLSGLHSYAAGDPMPIPPAIKWSVLTLTAIGVLAYLRDRRWRSSVRRDA